MDNKKRTCFIITPIGDEKDPIRRGTEGVIDDVIIPVMENDYEIKVAHRLFQVGSINKQVIKLIYESDLVIANLTNNNPNVMYELAFRHTLGLPTITIAEKGTQLPFDISTERTIFFTNDFQGAKETREELKKYLCQINYDSGQTTGPIHDYLDSVELNNLIYSHNQNKNTTEILELMAKRLESIDNSPTTHMKPTLNYREKISHFIELDKINQRLSELIPELRVLNSKIYSIIKCKKRAEKSLFEKQLLHCIFSVERCIGDINYMIYYKNRFTNDEDDDWYEDECEEE